MARTRRDSHPKTFEAVTSAIRRHLTVPGTDTPLEPYPEQIAGARALLDGAVAEMATGEGKTITAAFAAAVWAREGPVHIATANAYLAARDAALLAPVYADLGLSTGVVTPETNSTERKRQYAADIVYSTLAELGFDYLRDRLVTRASRRVQVRGLGALIVDEADLLLIDEARTPLVIARERSAEDGADLPALARLIESLVGEQAARIAAKLDQLRARRPRDFDARVLATQVRRGAPRDPAVLAYFTGHPAALKATEQTERELRGGSAWMLDDGLLYTVDERARTAYLTSEGQALIEAALGPIFAQPEISAESLAALHNLILAYALFRRDHDYLLRDGRVVLIEEATGRAAESRRYMHGLHGAIEVKELGLVEQENETLAQISVQQFVRGYARRAGMTGTALPAADEFIRIYNMPVVPIPRHRPNRRVDLPSRLYRTAAEVDAAVIADIAAAHALAQPVLAGTADVRRSERLSALLTAAGLPHVVLNARQHEREAEIVAAAGHPGAITIATNMAGRGTDIRLEDGLGRTIIQHAVDAIRRHATDGYVTIDCVSSGACSALRDALKDAGMSVERRGLKLSVRAIDGGDREANPTPGPSPAALERGALSGRGQHVVSASAESGAEASVKAPLPSCAREGPGVGFAGTPFALGLLVLSTEPQPNRRLDDQLRGRGGRQGDEGVTQLYASLEDDSLRFYGSPATRARAARALTQQPYLEGRPAARVIDDAQQHAERTHQGQRHLLFRFDQVIDAQRTAMLATYEQALEHPDPPSLVREFIPEVAAHEVVRRPDDPTRDAVWLNDLVRRYGLPFITEAPAESDLAAALAERFDRAATEAGRHWPGLARTALLRAAAELWAAHVEVIDQLQRQAPTTFGFLPGAPEIPFAKEATGRYEDYLWAVKAEALSALLTLPQPYERAVPTAPVPPLSPAAGRLLAATIAEEDFSSAAPNLVK